MKAVAGGLVALVLLGLYVYLVVIGCLVVDCVNTPGCSTYSVSGFNDVEAQALAVISGLITALVIAELATSKRGEQGSSSLLGENPSRLAKNTLTWTTRFYILAWLLTGLVAFMVGLGNPGTLPTLTAIGQTWFGIAIAIAYSYFGLKPD